MPPIVSTYVMSFFHYLQLDTFLLTAMVKLVVDFLDCLLKQALNFFKVRLWLTEIHWITYLHRFLPAILSILLRYFSDDYESYSNSKSFCFSLLHPVMLVSLLFCCLEMFVVTCNNQIYCSVIFLLCLEYVVRCHHLHYCNSC